MGGRTERERWKKDKILAGSFCISIGRDAAGGLILSREVLLPCVFHTLFVFLSL